MSRYLKPWAGRMALFCLVFFLGIQAAPAADGPPVLEESLDPVLGQELRERLASLGLMEAVRDNTLAVGVADITDPRHPRVAAVNPERMMYAASLPKIAILLGAFERIRAGDMQLDDDTREQLVRMIRYSSNRAASAMIDRVGMEYIAGVLTSPRYRLYDPSDHGGLWVGKSYGRDDVWKRDPLANLSHGANVLQVMRFYYLLETGKLVSPAFSRQMKAILGKPGIEHKFVKGLRREHPEARIYRKSGSWREWHADSAIVEHDGRRYIVAALARSPQGGRWLTRLVGAVDEVVFRTASPTLQAALDESM